MSFIQDEKERSSSMWDWIILALLVVGGAVFWWYYSSTKASTQEGFIHADSLFQAGAYRRAFNLYEELKNSDYLEPAHDSILFERLDTLRTILENAQNASPPTP